MTDRLPGQIDPPQATRAAREHHEARQHQAAPIPQVRPAEHTLLSTDDAMVWAEEFCRIFAGYTVWEHDEGHDGIDAGLMVAWFANAMQTAVNQYERRKLHEKGELTETEQFLQRWDEDHPEGDEEQDPTGEIDMSTVMADDEEDGVTLEEQFLEGFRDGRP
jgi:hypothetical protein